MLYDSLHEKLLTLPDATKVYPAHGAGSLCGRNISSDTSSTIGDQRRFNYALQPMAREEFVEDHDDGSARGAGVFRPRRGDEPRRRAARSARSRRRRRSRPRRGAPPGRGRDPPRHAAGGGVRDGARAGVAPRRTLGAVRFLGGRAARRRRETRARRGGSGARRRGADAAGARRPRERRGLSRRGRRRVAGLGPAARRDRADHGGRARAAPAAEARPRVVDVRRPMEWKAGHIAGARHVPLERPARPAGARSRRDRPAASSAPAATGRRSRRAFSSGGVSA